MRKKDWTGIHFLEKTSYYDGKDSRIGALLWPLVSFASFCLLQLSAFAIFFKGISMAYSTFKILGIIVIVCALFFGLSFRRQFLWAGMGVAAVGLGLYAWLKFDVVSAGFMSIYERCYALVNDYIIHGITDQGSWEGELKLAVYAFVALAACLYGVFCYFGLRSAFPVLIPGVLAIVGVFFVGKVPELFYLAMFCIFACVFVSSSYTGLRFGKYGTLTALGSHFYIRGESKAVHKIGAKTGLFMLAVLLLSAGLALLAGNGIGLPESNSLAYYQQQIRDWSKEHLNLLENWGRADAPPQGGISGGDLAGAGDLYYNGDEQIRVTVGERPEANLYIKGYVGDKYENNRWNIGSGGDYAKALQAADSSDPADFLSFSYELFSQFSQDHMTIEKLAVFGSYDFFPYGARIDDAAKWVNDTYIQGKSASTDFDFTPIIYPLAGSYDDLTVHASQFLSNNLSAKSMEQVYRQYVYDHYLDVPGETSQMLDAFTGGTVPAALDEKVKYVRRLLGNTCTYSLTPGPLPQGRDFTEYFLMDNRTGYCMHFATAATLLLRNMGVPARYVEGYIMVPGNFSLSANGFEGIAYDHQAHAWTEIYLDGVGWLPVEMTPSYYDPATIESDVDESEETVEDSSLESGSETQPESETQSEPETSPESESRTESTPWQPQSDSGENNPDAENAQESSGVIDGAQKTSALNVLRTVLLWLCAVIAVVALVTALILLRAAALSKRRIRAMRQKNRSKAVVAIYQHLLRLFEICGYDKTNVKSLHLYFEAVAKDCDFIDVDACDNLVALANAAAFSRDGVTQEQWQECWHMYQRIRSGMYKSQKTLKRLIMRYLYGC